MKIKRITAKIRKIKDEYIWLQNKLPKLDIEEIRLEVPLEKTSYIVKPDFMRTTADAPGTLFVGFLKEDQYLALEFKAFQTKYKYLKLIVRTLTNEETLKIELSINSSTIPIAKVKLDKGKKKVISLNEKIRNLDDSTFAEIEEYIDDFLAIFSNKHPLSKYISMNR